MEFDVRNDLTNHSNNMIPRKQPARQLYRWATGGTLTALFCGWYHNLCDQPCGKRHGESAAAGGGYGAGS